MSKKDTIKNIFDEKINKKHIYDEILLKNERKDEKHMNKSLKYVIAATCILLVTVCGILFMNQNKELKPIIEEEDSIIYINQIDSQELSNLDADLEMIEQDITVKGGRFEPIDELEDYSFYKDLEISDDYNAFVIYAIYVRADRTSKKYDILNNYVISYKVKDKEKDFKNIEIAFSKEYEPLRDYFFTSENDKKSTINGLELEIYQYGNSYMTKFKSNGINFDIETHNVNDKEFVALLKSIIK